MKNIQTHQSLPDGQYADLHRDLRDWLIKRDCGGWDGLTEAEQAEVLQRASTASHLLIRESLRVLGKDLKTALADGSIFEAIVSPLPLPDIEITTYVNGKRS